MSDDDVTVICIDFSRLEKEWKGRVSMDGVSWEQEMADRLLRNQTSQDAMDAAKRVVEALANLLASAPHGPRERAALKVAKEYTNRVAVFLESFK